MEQRFKLTDEKKVNAFGVKLFRIEVIKTFKHKFVGEIKKGTIGGWVDNLARVFGDAWVSGDVEVFGNARVSGDARVFGNAKVFGDAWVSGECKIKITLCSRFNFEFQWQVDEWVKLEKSFEDKLKEMK